MTTQSTHLKAKPSIYCKLIFIFTILISLIFSTLSPLESEAETKKLALQKLSSKDSITIKKNYPYKKKRSLKKVRSKKINKKTTQLFQPNVENIGNHGKWVRKKPRGNWSIILGGLSSMRPRYKGSDQYKFNGLPFIDIKYKKSFFLNFRQGLGANIFHTPNFKAGIALNFYGDRDVDDSDSLKGFQSIDSGADAGAFSSISFGNISAKIKFRQDISNNHNGLLISGRIGYKVSLFKKLRTNLNIGTTFANDKYTNTYFGINSTQSIASGLKEYNASSGIKSINTGVNFMYPFDDHWSMLTLLNYSQLLNDAARSPLVKDLGSKNQIWLALGAAYRF